MLSLITRRFWRVVCCGALCAVVTTDAQVKINEILTDNESYLFTDGSITDWVELYNPSAQAIDLGGYSLTDASTTPRKWVVPAGVSIPANGYLMVLLDSTRPASTGAGPILNAGFGLRATGDDMQLYSPATVLVESVRFGPQAADYSIGRVPTGTGNFVLTRPTPGTGNIQQPLGAQAGLRINEWMASPSSGNDWFEIFNPDALPVQLTGLFFTDNNNVPSPVAPLSYIGGGLNGFLQFFADNNTNDNEVSFGLGGGGDSINLFFGNGTAIDRVQFGQQTPGLSQGRVPDGSASIQGLNTATPGESNLILYQGLVVNELLSHTDPPLEDAVEFYNQTAAPIDIGGWYLSNSRSDLRRYRISAGTTIPAGGYIVFYENQFNGGAAATPFNFSSWREDQVYLSRAVNDQLTGEIVTESFEPSENGVSFGRVETSVPGDHKFVALSSRTFGADNPTTVEQFRTGTGLTNSGPRVGPVVINEVMYHPLSPDGVTDNTADEYIEFFNSTGASVALFDPLYPTNRWIIRGGVDFTFPPSSFLAASEVILLVSFDPADTARLAAFQSKFSVPTGVRIFGPYLGRLGNGGDEVELYRPDAPQGAEQPEPGLVPYIRVDKVNYSDVAPWPTAADGTGKSLQRKSATAFGNDPINWEAADPTAGRSNSGNGGGTGPVLTQITRSGSTVTLQFSAVAGRSYTVEARDNLQATSSWQSLGAVTASTASVTFSDSQAIGSQRYYRVVSN